MKNMEKLIRVLVAAWSLGSLGLAAEPDILIANFEGTDYGGWKATGEAFGPGPARGTLPSQMDVSGFEGKGLVNSYYKGDRTTGTLTSPPVTIQRKYLNFLIGGGMHPGRTCINLLVEGKVVRTATGPNDRPGGSERLQWHSWDVSDLAGKSAVLQIVDQETGGWGHINIDQIVLGERPKAAPIVADRLYEETYRPQFHFTPIKNWTNDPNGLVYYAAEYHLFFQHNPTGINWGNMTWGHAVSPDLVHWKQLDHAIHPDALGTIFSGSAVVDWGNTAGFQTGAEKAIVCIYTSAGKPFTQSIAYSLNRGRTWTKYARNPVLGHIAGENRDPKVIWHEPTRKWIMALFLDKNDYALFASGDLKEWKRLCDVPMPGSGECPDFFPLATDGDPRRIEWVFWAANGNYRLGTFDGAVFKPRTEPIRSLWGANDYAAQTYSDIPAEDGRRIQLAWMSGGKYPGMPFNQQMSFPRELSLRTTPEGPRLHMTPVREIERIRGRRHAWTGLELRPDDNPLAGLKGELWDIEAEIAPGEAPEVVLAVRGEPIRYDAKGQALHCLGRSAPLRPEGGAIQLRVLVDRTSIEIFAGGGRITMCSCFLPAPSNRSLALTALGGKARVRSLTIYELKSAWQ